MSNVSANVKLLLKQVHHSRIDGEDCQLTLTSSLGRIADGKKLESELDSVLKAFSRMDDFHWIVSAAYWSLRNRANLLPAGVVFTPPRIASKVVNRLIPGVDVVDLGCGTGMLSLVAAKCGYRVIAIEEDAEMLLVLDYLARILKVRDRLDIRLQDALKYKGVGGQQIMSNPPYTRHQEIENGSKKALALLAAGLGVQVPLTAGQHAYFMLYAWTSEWSEREVLLLPTNWLDAKYGTTLRQMLVSRGPSEIEILTSRDGKSVFEHAATTACLITTKFGSSFQLSVSSSVGVRIVWPRSSHESRTKNLSISHIKFKEALSVRRKAVRKGRDKVGDFFRVKRGIATGANSFFVLSDSDVKECGLPTEELHPILRKLSTGRSSGERQYLWVPRIPSSSNSRARVRRGKRLGIDKRYLCAHRSRWWRVPLSPPPDYFISYMGHGRPLVKRNASKLLNLNNIHGIYLKSGVTRGNAKKVIDWLGSKKGQDCLLERARWYQGGLWKLEPGDIEQLPLPAVLLQDKGK